MATTCCTYIKMATRRFTRSSDGRWVPDDGRTRYIQDADTGYMQGRLGTGERLTKTQVQKKHWSAKPDKTKVRRVVVPYTATKRGHVRHYGKGQIIGRLSN
jgi:hypothetical protein